ncbi:MAG: hypothetical protein KC621_31030, partial [Myxococcales bacterium]|nr:hypothetical protein [Myxococcales bacterium]
MPTPLGPFELHQPLARGGMATVWTGRHVEQDVPVAIKVMSGLTGTADDQRRFAEEVRAVAALDHPGVVMVLDHGRIDARAAAADDRLVEGSPWLAMEFASGGTLARLKDPLPWPALKALLLALLDAL